MSSLATMMTVTFVECDAIAACGTRVNMQRYKLEIFLHLNSSFFLSELVLKLVMAERFEKGVVNAKLYKNTLYSKALYSTILSLVYIVILYSKPEVAKLPRHLPQAPLCNYL